MAAATKAMVIFMLMIVSLCGTSRVIRTRLEGSSSCVASVWDSGEACWGKGWFGV